MSDSSDSDGSLSNDLFTFGNESTMVSARGPNINLNNITDLSFRNYNVFSSTLKVPRPYERPRYAQSSYDQRSISYRGDASPRSIRSACNRSQRANYSYNRGTGGPRSMYNGRSQSPMSVRSIESSASAYVLDATQVLNNSNYNEYELDILEKACYKFLNHRMKRKIKKTYVSSNSSQQSIPSGSNRSFSNNIFSKPPAPAMTQKERFKTGYQLPSQRFNRSIITTSIQEIGENEHLSESNYQNIHSALNKNSERNIETDSDEDIFSTTNKKPRHSRKRSIDSEDLFLPNTKRIKPISSCKNCMEAQKQKATNDKTNDFVFAKPVCPARKTVKEKLISKSAAPLIDAVPQISIIPPQKENPRLEKPVEEEIEEEQSSTCNSTNLSMRPSFIKRKLFTQTLDFEEKNVSDVDTPKKETIKKEKHKTRKLQQATTQSCLSRDIDQDESNILDLIHKIVPINQMNVTNQTNKTVSQSKNMIEDDDDDEPSIITTNRNDDNESDTYTDEEMLNHTVKELQKEDATKKHLTTKDDKVHNALKELQKGDATKKTVKTKEDTVNELQKENAINKNTANKEGKVSKPKNCKVLLEKLPAHVKQPIIKQFWDTDFETDDELIQSPRTDKINSKETAKPGYVQPEESPIKPDFSKLFNSKKSTASSIFNALPKNYTFDTTQKFNNTFRIRCHKAPKRNKIDRITNEDTDETMNKAENKKKNLESISAKIPNLEQEIVTEKENNKKSVTKQDNKSLKNKKSTAKIDNQTQSLLKSDIEKQFKIENHDNKKEINAKYTQKNAEKPTNKQQMVENNVPTKKPLKSNEKNVSRNKSPNAKEKIAHTKKQSRSNEKLVESKLSHNKILNTKENITLTKELSKSNEKLVESEIQQHKSHNSRNTTQKNNLPAMEENNNKTNRPVRSCRENSLNQSTDKSLTQNDSMNRTLRSTVNINSNKNNTKVQRDKKYILARLSDVSFSLGAKKNIAKKAVTKTTNLDLNADESDVSFSLNPTPRKTRASSRNNSMNSTPLRKNASQIRLHIRDYKPVRGTRNRTPNKRYV